MKRINADKYKFLNFIRTFDINISQAIHELDNNSMFAFHNTTFLDIVLIINTDINNVTRENFKMKL